MCSKLQAQRFPVCPCARGVTIRYARGVSVGMLRSPGCERLGEQRVGQVAVSEFSSICDVVSRKMHSLVPARENECSRIKTNSLWMCHETNRCSLSSPTNTIKTVFECVRVCEGCVLVHHGREA